MRFCSDHQRESKEAEILTNPPSSIRLTGCLSLYMYSGISTARSQRTTSLLHESMKLGHPK